MSRDDLAAALWSVGFFLGMVAAGFVIGCIL